MKLHKLVEEEKKIVTSVGTLSSTIVQRRSNSSIMFRIFVKPFLDFAKTIWYVAGFWPIGWIHSKGSSRCFRRGKLGERYYYEWFHGQDDFDWALEHLDFMGKLKYEEQD